MNRLITRVPWGDRPGDAGRPAPDRDLPAGTRVTEEPPEAAGVAVLQRAAGNAAVSRMLTSLGGGRRLMRLVALRPEDHTAVAEQLHEAMAGWGTNEEKIYVSLQRLGRDPTAIAEQRKAYKDKYGKDLEAEVRGEMSGDELRLALELMGIVDPKAGAEVDAGAPTDDAGMKRAASRLYGAMKGLGTDEETVYAVLIPFDRDPAGLGKLKTTYQSELSGGLTGKGLEADINDEMSDEELHYALFLLNAPPPRAPTGMPGVPDPGTEVHTGAVEGGTVSVRTGAQLTPGGDKEGYSVGYKGGLSDESAWLQFIWREIVVDHPDKGQYRVDQPITTTGGTYDLTTDPAKPSYNTDTASGTDPFYEAGGMSGRTAEASTMFDMPGPATAIVNAQFAAGATKVVSRAHFNTFLIRDFRAIYHVTVDVEWEFTSATAVPRTQKASGKKAAEHLPDDIRVRLVAQFPSFAYIQ